MNNGVSKVTNVTQGWDPVSNRPNGALIMNWAGDATAKSARLCIPASNGTLSAVTAYTAGTTNRKAWWVLNGVNLPGNTLVRAKLGVPVDAVAFSNIEIACMDLFVAPAKGATEQLCVVITAGSNQPTAEVGMLAWGTPGEGTFTGANNPVVVALGNDVFVRQKNLTGETPNVVFVVNR
jgi:hypothetical protein